MLENIIVVGDIHHQYKEPKHSQINDFLSWLFYDSGLNKPENELLLLGDLVETLDDPSELLEIYIDLFLNKSKFEHITILKGNHDENMNSSFTSALRPLHNVQIIEQIQSKIYNMDNSELRLLFLPYYDHTKNKLIPLSEYYCSDSIKEIYGDTEFDYTFTHTEDELSHYSKNYPDLSWVKTKHFLNGHIHTETITKGGRVLGSPVFNSSTESGKQPYIAKINISTKNYELIKVPIFMEYYSVDYPEEIIIPKTKYGIFTVNESLNKKETINYYSKMAKEKGFTFYCRRVNSKRIEKKLIVDDKTDTTKLSYKEMYNKYKIDNKVSNEISDICLDIINKKEA